MKEKSFNLENSYMGLPNIFYREQKPSHVPSPELVVLNYSLIEELGLNVKELESSYGVEILSGNKIPEGGIPIAKAYGGHQFGHFTMLGDGRAVLIGEQITPRGHRVDIELKGSGKTPYSRGGDGKASLGSMLREYIISEAMNGLGIPSTRSLAVVTTGETIFREKMLQGAVLTRIASSHIRVGTFQYASKWGDIEDVKALADYTLERHFKDGLKADNKYLYLLKEVIKSQAELISKWQLVGFIHGVMNTDNMTISGETIDYGPCAFMDTYDPATVFSSIDTNGRYAYGNQPNIGVWNLARFAETLLPLLHEKQEEAIKLAQAAISEFAKIFEKNWSLGMRKKLGLFNEEEEDKFLIEGLLSTMKKYGADFTNTFRALTTGNEADTGMVGKEEFDKWIQLWKQRLTRQDKSQEEVVELMKKSNPAVIPRNHRVEEALDYATNKGDYSVMDRLMEVLKNPYEYSNAQEEYVKLPKGDKGVYRTFCGT
ncbi:MAG: YdiU family protein [Clostridium sp.]|uniref:protein adenylyltransferase SelO n=1 Tax=Clostridium sp. TaxID=1506 RepID=UPI003063E4B8